jgi:Raf kinase inhibitor-like YbhB/YbcL family protein
MLRDITPLGLALLLVLAACGGGDDGPSNTAPADNEPLEMFEMQSSAFADEAEIPARYTCDGEDISPSLFWEEPPEGTEAFMLIVDDPDAPSGTFTHWVYYDIPGDSRSLPENVPQADEPPSGGTQGENSAGETGYSGPCPPSGPAHHYVFTLTALDAELDLPPGASKAEALEAGHNAALGEAKLTGTYARQ